MGLFDKLKKKKQKDSVESFFGLLSDSLQDASQKANEAGSIIFDEQEPDRADFGLCETNPICVYSLSEANAYLKRLCTKSGQTFTWSHYTSIRASLRGLSDIGEDKYTLYLDGKPYTDIYFVLYAGQTDFPPAGLYFVDEDKDWDLEREAFCKGVTAEELLEVRELEKEVEKEKLAKQQEKASKASSIREAIELDAKNMLEIYPDFDLEAELKGGLFKDLANLGFSVKAVYEYVHRAELFSKRAISEDISQGSGKYTVDYYFNKLLQLENHSEPVIKDISAKSKTELEQEASKYNISIDQLIDLRTMECEHAKLKWSMYLDSLKKWAEQAYVVKQSFPAFNIEDDWKNESFQKLLQKVNMSVAHEFLHFADYYEAKISDAEKKVAAKGSENNYCRKCGAKLHSDSTFCHKCGAKVIEVL